MTTQEKQNLTEELNFLKKAFERERKRYKSHEIVGYVVLTIFLALSIIFSLNPLAALLLLFWSMKTVLLFGEQIIPAIERRFTIR